jgi:hypothetical protein
MEATDPAGPARRTSNSADNAGYSDEWDGSAGWYRWLDSSIDLSTRALGENDRAVVSDNSIDNSSVDHRYSVGEEMDFVNASVGEEAIDGSRQLGRRRLKGRFDLIVDGGNSTDEPTEEFKVCGCRNRHGSPDLFRSCG